MQNRIFSETLRALMDKRGATQESVADALKTTQPTVSRWLKGQIPKGLELKKLAEFFQCPMESFFGPVTYHQADQIVAQTGLPLSAIMGEEAGANREIALREYPAMRKREQKIENALNTLGTHLKALDELNAEREMGRIILTLAEWRREAEAPKPSNFT